MHERDLGEPYLVNNDQVYITKQPLKEAYNITLSESIDHETKGYYELLHFFYTVSADDIVFVRMGNFGGALEQCVKICNAIKACQAPVHIIVDAPCYSAGAIISVVGDSLDLKPGTFLMFHNYSGGERGKAGEVRSSVEAHNKNFKKFLEKFCGPFLTKPEINRIINDNDVYIYADDPDLQKRIGRHFK